MFIGNPELMPGKATLDAPLSTFIPQSRMPAKPTEATVLAVWC